MKKRWKLVCTACGSTAISRDAFACWSEEEQCYELKSTLDDASCDDCGAEGSSAAEFVGIKDQAASS